MRKGGAQTSEAFVCKAEKQMPDFQHLEKRCLFIKKIKINFSNALLMPYISHKKLLSFPLIGRTRAEFPVLQRGGSEKDMRSVFLKRDTKS